MTPLEQTIESIKALPPADRRQLRLFLQAQERHDAPPPAATPTGTPTGTATPATETVEQQLARFRKATDWIRAHRAEYLGQWVVLVGDQLISHGFDAHRVDEEAIAAGIETPFIVLITEEPEAVMGGFQ